MNFNQNKSQIIAGGDSHEEEKNIFDEFKEELGYDSTDKSIKNIKKEKLFKNISTFFVMINISLFTLLLISAGYFYVQKNENIKDVSFLEPVCGLLLGKDSGNRLSSSGCSSLNSLNKEYIKKISEEENKKYKKIKSLVVQYNDIINFSESSAIKLINSSIHKRVYFFDILNDFDKLKNEFSGKIKSSVYCYNLKVNLEDSEIDVTCDVKTTDWEKDSIPGSLGSKDKTVEGTSISGAASLVNFIEKNEDRFNFQLLKKESSFKSQDFIDGPFTKKSSVDLKLKFTKLNSDTNLYENKLQN